MSVGDPQGATDRSLRTSGLNNIDELHYWHARYFEIPFMTMIFFFIKTVITIDASVRTIDMFAFF